MTLPNLLLAGTQKGGTTWLHEQLSRHPDIFMSKVKEVGYLHSGNGTLTEYESYFKGSDVYRWRGEATPHYFWRRDSHSPYSAGRRHDTAVFARELLGTDVAILLSLRDPVSRAVSAYFHHIAMGRLERGRNVFRCPPELGIVDLGFYKRHWQHWESVFGEENIHLLLFDDLEMDPNGFLADALRFLRVDPQKLEDVNLRKVAARRGAERFQRTESPITRDDVEALLYLYRDTIEFVERLSGRDLTRWTDFERLCELHCW